MKTRAIPFLVAIFIALPVLALVFGSERPAAAQDDPAADEVNIELADGQTLEGVVRKVAVEGLVIDFSGVPMQLDWSLVRAERFTKERAALVDWNNPVSVQSYGGWAKAAAADGEYRRADEAYAKLTGRLLDGSAAPGNTGPGPGVDGSNPEPQPQPVPQPTPRPSEQLPYPSGAKTVTIDFTGDEELKKALMEKLRAAKVDIKDKGGDITVKIKDASIVTPKETIGSFMGDVISAVSRATATADIETGKSKEFPKGKTHFSEKFDTGDKEVRDLKGSPSDDPIGDSKKRAREALVDQMSKWLLPKLPQA